MTARRRSCAFRWAFGSIKPSWWRAGSNIEQASTPQFYIDFARKAEAAKIDAIFFPDIPVLDRKALGTDPVLNAFEPLMPTAYLAAATSHIGWCRAYPHRSASLILWRGSSHHSTG